MDEISTICPNSDVFEGSALKLTIDARHTRSGLFRDLLARKSTLIIHCHLSWVIYWIVAWPMISAEEESNFETFRDCLSTVLIERLAPATAKPKKRVKGRKNEIKPVVRVNTGEEGETDAAELSEFTEVGTAH